MSLTEEWSRQDEKDSELECRLIDIIQSEQQRKNFFFKKRKIYKKNSTKPQGYMGKDLSEGLIFLSSESKERMRLVQENIWRNSVWKLHKFDEGNKFTNLRKSKRIVSKKTTSRHIKILAKN